LTEKMDITGRRAIRIALPVAVAGAAAAALLVVHAPAAGGGGTRGPRMRELASLGIAKGARERASVDATDLSLGRVRLDLVSRHPAGVHWGGRDVSWYVGSGRGRLERVGSTRTREARPGVTRATTVLSLPRAGRFRFAACFAAPGQDALGLAGSHGPCGTRRFRGPDDSPYVGTGVAPAGRPGRRPIAAAARYLAGRDGYTSFAVIDSEGRLHGQHAHRTFVSASVVKAMLLVAYLRELAHHHRGLDADARSLLEPMIHVSDNEAADAVWELDGDRRLRALARRAGMTDFSIEGIWANAMISAADQARYFFEMESLIPPRFRHFADHLLSHIAGYESWGIPAVARPHGWTVYFKGGWRGTWRGQLVHQIARLHKHGERLAIAVMTDGDPSMEYGIETIEGVAKRLLGTHASRRTPAGSAP
jgi:Beta-lactamase enzyme family